MTEQKSKLSILLVEDDFAGRVVMQKYLDRWGETDTAVGGREAVSKFIESVEAGEPYQLICLDVMMPELNGFEALRQIREFEKKKEIPTSELVKVIITSALSDSETLSYSFRYGCEAYLVKPITRESLEKEMRRLNLIS